MTCRASGYLLIHSKLGQKRINFLLPQLRGMPPVVAKNEAGDNQETEWIIARRRPVNADVMR